MNGNSLKKFRHFVEYLIIRIIFLILSVIPINLVSFFGGKIFRFLGYFSKSHQIAISNYKKIFTEASNEIVSRDILKSWENIGKTICEISILKKIIDKKNNKISVENFENIEFLLKEKKPAIFFGLHQSNWEICVPLLDRLGFQVGAIYRHINNKFIDEFLLKKRTESLVSKKSFYTAKGRQSAKDILDAVKKKSSVFLLIDQKDSSGELINFFRYKTKTQTGFLKIARKYDLFLVPMENIRLKNNNFTIKFHKPFKHSNYNVDDSELMLEIHKITEKWILNNPSQWFWQHNRFN